VQRIAIDFGIDRHRLNAQLVARSQDSHGDLATISNEDFFEHRGVFSGVNE
jgi:hypothetical protein